MAKPGHLRQDRSENFPAMSGLSLCETKFRQAVLADFIFRSNFSAGRVAAPTDTLIHIEEPAVRGAKGGRMMHRSRPLLGRVAPSRLNDIWRRDPSFGLREVSRIKPLFSQRF